MDPSAVSWFAVFAAALSAFLVGGLWYSPILFAKPWMRANGLSEEELRQGTVRTFVGAFVLAFVIATNLAFFLGPAPGIAWGTGAGILAGLGWVACSTGITALFERKPFSLVAINAGYHIVAYAVMGLVLGVLSG